MIDADLAATTHLAVRWLSRRAYSSHKLRKKLAEKGILPERIDPTITELTRRGWLNDEAYAAARVRDWLRSGYGPAWMLARGKQERIPVTRDLITQQASELDLSLDQKLDAWIQKKINALRPENARSWATARNKILASLARKGFSPGDVIRALNRYAPSLFAVCLCFLVSKKIEAIDSLPYTTRTRPYLGLSSSVRGDLRTLGMAGATVGLADTLLGAHSNPAGLAMALEVSGLQTFSNKVSDAYLQSMAEPVRTSSLITGAMLYPWGFSVGYTSPANEGQPYQLGSDVVAAEVYTGELRASLARVFFSNHLAVGASLIVGRASRKMVFLDSSDRVETHTSWALGADAGIEIQLPKRWLIGFAAKTPLEFDGSPQSTTGIAGFFQPVRVPTTFGLGIGWIPNRIFRIGLSVRGIGPISGTAPLSDNAQAMKSALTIQPHLGALYRLIDYKELRASLALGTYYEITRYEGRTNRVHGTVGAEISPWIFDLGWGVDLASRYSNFLILAGVNVVKLMQKLDLIPMEDPPPTFGFFPNPTENSDLGLPRPLVKNWKPRIKKIDLLEAGKNLPGNIEKKIEHSGDTLQGIGSDVLDTIKEVPQSMEEEFREEQNPSPPQQKKSLNNKKKRFKSSQKRVPQLPIKKPKK